MLSPSVSRLLLPCVAPARACIAVSIRNPHRRQSRGRTEGRAPRLRWKSPTAPASSHLPSPVFGRLLDWLFFIFACHDALEALTVGFHSLAEGIDLCAAFGNLTP